MFFRKTCKKSLKHHAEENINFSWKAVEIKRFFAKEVFNIFNFLLTHIFYAEPFSSSLL